MMSSIATGSAPPPEQILKHDIPTYLLKNQNIFGDVNSTLICPKTKEISTYPDLQDSVRPQHSF